MVNIREEAQRIDRELKFLRHEEARQRSEIVDLCQAFNPAVAGQFATIVDKTVNFGIEKQELAKLFGYNVQHIDTLIAGKAAPSANEQKVYVNFMMQCVQMQQNF